MNEFVREALVRKKAQMLYTVIARSLQKADNEAIFWLISHRIVGDGSIGELFEIILIL